LRSSNPPTPGKDHGCRQRNPHQDREYQEYSEDHQGHGDGGGQQDAPNPGAHERHPPLRTADAANHPPFGPRPSRVSPPLLVTPRRQARRHPAGVHRPGAVRWPQRQPVPWSAAADEAMGGGRLSSGTEHHRPEGSFLLRRDRGQDRGAEDPSGRRTPFGGRHRCGQGVAGQVRCRGTGSDPPGVQRVRQHHDPEAGNPEGVAHRGGAAGGPAQASLGLHLRAGRQGRARRTAVALRGVDRVPGRGGKQGL